MRRHPRPTSLGAPRTDAGFFEAGDVDDNLTAEKADGRLGPGAPGQPKFAEAAVRSNFADTAFWAASISTNDEGIAELEFDMPRESFRLEAPRLDDGPRHTRRRRLGRSRHA